MQPAVSDVCAARRAVAIALQQSAVDTFCMVGTRIAPPPPTVVIGAERPCGHLATMLNGLLIEHSGLLPRGQIPNRRASARFCTKELYITLELSFAACGKGISYLVWANPNGLQSQYGETKSCQFRFADSTNGSCSHCSSSRRGRKFGNLVVPPGSDPSPALNSFSSARRPESTR